MKFEYEANPQVDGQYKRKILAPGRASYVVEKAIESISKSSGNPMIELTLMVTDQLGQKERVWFYLLHNKPGTIKAFVASAGRDDLYNSNAELKERDLPGLIGSCEIKTDFSKNPKYPDKTTIDYFIVPLPGSNYGIQSSTNQYTTPSNIDDDIPF
jgi:hypothetical protein